MVVVLGGIVATMLVSLLVVPILYAKFGLVTYGDAWADDLMEPEAKEPAEPRAASSSVMQRLRLAFLAAPLALMASACGGPVADAYTIEHEPASVVTAPGSGHARSSSRRRPRSGWPSRRQPSHGREALWLVPSSAVFVDPEGKWWVYTNRSPSRSNARRSLSIREAGGVAYLSRGP